MPPTSRSRCSLPYRGERQGHHNRRPYADRSAENQKSGLAKALYILKNIDGIAHIELDEEDVVRHRLVKAIIKAYEKEKNDQGDAADRAHEYRAAGNNR